MIEIRVIVDHVEAPAQQRQRNIADVIQTRDQRLHLEFVLHEPDLLGKNRVLKLMQETAENRVAVRRAAFGQLLLRTILSERLFVEFHARRRAAPVTGQRLFVDQVDAVERRVLGPGESGVRIPVGHPAFRKFLPARHCGAADRDQHLHLALVVEIALRNVVAGFEGTVRIEVGRDVEPLLLHPEEQVVELVEPFGTTSQRIRSLRVQQQRIVMMNPHRVVTAVDEIVGQLIDRLLRQIVRREAEIRPVEADALSGSLLEGQRTGRRRPDEAVFPGRRIGEE